MSVFTCTCGSQNVFQTHFRRHAHSGFGLDSTHSGFFNEVTIVPEVWVCEDCRKILFRVPEHKMDFVRKKGEE